MYETLIIGKDSNLSKHLLSTVERSYSFSAREISSNDTGLNRFKKSRINLIFNNFQPAVELNQLTSTFEYISNSITVTAKILDFFKNSKINKIIYTSSSSVYGNNIYCNEKDELKPLNLHASLKVANEKLIEKFCLTNNIDFTIARIFNMYGGSDKFSIISKIIDSIKSNKEITIVNQGNAIRDFIHIDDVVEIYLKLLDLKDINYVNIGTGNGISIKNILDFLKNKGIDLKIKNIDKEELKVSTADNHLVAKITDKYLFKEIENFFCEELNI